MSFEVNLSLAQRAVYKELSRNVSIQKGSSAEYIRGFVNTGYEMLKHKKEDINKQINHNNDTLSTKLADEANSKLKQELADSTDNMKKILSEVSAEFFMAKRNAVTEFIKQIPSDSLDRKIQYIKDYGHLFDKSVWEIFITDPQIASNYLASKIVEKLAEENKIDYVIKFRPERTFEMIDQLEMMVNTSIAHIDNDDDLYLMSLISNNQNSPISQLISELDSDYATIIPAEKLSLFKRLGQAQKKAYDNDDIRLSVTIERFMENHKSELATPEEINEELYQRAEDLISQGMATKKG